MYIQRFEERTIQKVNKNINSKLIQLKVHKVYSEQLQPMAQSAEPTLKCKRNGCRKQYRQSENTDTSCGYHPGKPIFHDTKKGWTCCNKIVYDWDQFQKLPTCATANHSDKKQEQQQQFFKSNTVANAQSAIQKSEKSAIVINDINKYNADLQAKKKKEEEEKQKNGEEKKLFKSKSGKLKCVNQGCAKKFIEEENNEDSCHFHKGQPVFHDLKKYWTCCGKETFDWDEFMKLPKCCSGYHSPKYL